MGWWPAAWTGASGRLLGAVEVGQEGELVHDADQAAVGRRGRPVFEGLDVFGLDQWRGCSMGGQQFGERVREAGQQRLGRGQGTQHRRAGSPLRRRPLHRLRRTATRPGPRPNEQSPSSVEQREHLPVSFAAGERGVVPQAHTLRENPIASAWPSTRCHRRSGHDIAVHSRQHPRHEREPHRGQHDHDRHDDERCLQRGRIRQRADGTAVRARRDRDIVTQLVVVR
jgi:hypothetical protein